MTVKALHERIRNDIERCIMSGALGPGDRLPIESELMQRYGCARMTVNKALSSLVEAGLIERRKRAGSFVSRPHIHSMILDIPDLATEVIARGQSYEYRPVSVIVRRSALTNPVVASLGGAADVLEVSGVHFADDVPFAFEDRRISLLAVPDARAVDYSKISPGAWLLSHVPWSEAENRISAIAATTDVARHLDVEPGAACLLVERRTWRGGVGITQVHQYFLGGNYDLVAKFGRQSG